MKAILLACTLTSISAPALAQEACPRGENATEEFVVTLSETNGALTARNYGRVLSLSPAARAAAASPMQRMAVTNLEIAALIGMDDRTVAAKLMKEVMPEPCLSDHFRTTYAKKLAEWGVAAE